MTHPSLDYAFEAQLFDEGATVPSGWYDSPAKIPQSSDVPGEGHGGDGTPPPPPPPVRRLRPRAE